MKKFKKVIRIIKKKNANNHPKTIYGVCLKKEIKKIKNKKN